MRRGIQFGPEVDPPTESEKTVKSRGLLFACYQTSIIRGFKLHQQCKIFSLILFLHPDESAH